MPNPLPPQMSGRSAISESFQQSQQLLGDQINYHSSQSLVNGSSTNLTFDPTASTNSLLHHPQPQQQQLQQQLQQGFLHPSALSLHDDLQNEESIQYDNMYQNQNHEELARYDSYQPQQQPPPPQQQQHQYYSDQYYYPSEGMVDQHQQPYPQDPNYIDEYNTTYDQLGYDQSHYDQSQYIDPEQSIYPESQALDMYASVGHPSATGNPMDAPQVDLSNPNNLYNANAHSANSESGSYHSPSLRANVPYVANPLFNQDPNMSTTSFSSSASKPLPRFEPTHKPVLKVNPPSHRDEAPPPPKRYCTFRSKTGAFCCCTFTLLVLIIAAIAIYFVFIFKVPDVQFDGAGPANGVQSLVVTSNTSVALNWNLKFNIQNDNFWTISLYDVEYTGNPPNDNSTPTLASGKVDSMDIQKHQSTSFTFPVTLKYDMAATSTGQQAYFKSLVNTCSSGNSGQISMLVKIKFGVSAIKFTNVKFPVDRTVSFPCPFDTSSIASLFK